MLIAVLNLNMKASKNTSWNDLAIPEFPISSNAWSLIMLEAWRRGLKVEIFANRHYVISSAERSYGFRLGRLTNAEAARGAQVCNDKYETKLCFVQNKLPTPIGRVFKAPFDKGSILGAANELQYPLCLKATGWSKGKGVYPGLTDKKQLQKFLNILIDDLECKSLLLEEHFEGDDFRFFVAGETVSAVIQRVAANIEGDGKSNVVSLIAQKNSLRKKNPYLKSALIEIDEEVEYMLERQGYNLDSIIPASEILYLREKSNASAGGDSINVTDRVSDESKQLAISAIKAIPGISHGGVDILLREPFTDNETATLIEINQSAEIGLHLYPAYGRAAYPPHDIIDCYFPESRKNPRATNWYFDLAAIFQLIRSKAAESVVVNPIPDTSKLVWREILVSGKVQGVGFRKWVARRARRLTLHGTIRNCPNGQVELRVAARKSKVAALLTEFEANRSPGNVEEIQVKEIDDFQISAGFRIL